MKKERRISKQTGMLLASAMAIPCCLFVVCLALLKMAPFGNETVLLRDSVGQYIDFISYLKTIIAGENDLFYTFSKNLGGDMLSLMAYYLISPFNLLFAFSTTENLPLFYTAVVILKLSLCGGVMYFVLDRQYGAKISHLIFSTAYAFMAYNIFYEWNIMWLDGVMVLPLIGYGVYKIWNHNSYKLYIISLAYALLTNFYIGYMLCAASVIFCAAYFVLFEGTWRQRFGYLGKFIAASAISGLSTAVVWVPSFLALRSGRAQFSRADFLFEPNFELQELIGKLIPGAGGADQLSSGLPHIFCGTFVLFGVLVFFLNRKISIKKRIVALIAVSVVLVSLYIRALDVAWHGFSPNNSFNHRYSFLFSYLLIMLAQYALSRGEETSRWTLGAAAALVAGMLYFAYKENFDYLPVIGIIIGLVVLVVVFAGSMFKVKAKQLISALLVLVCVCEMGANSYLILDSVVGEVWTLEMDQYGNFTQVAEPAVEYVKEKDQGFYRMEKTFHRTTNDPMFYNYSGLTHFSSTGQTFILDFLQRMGYTTAYDVWSSYNAGSNATADSLLGIKYVLGGLDLTGKGYEKIQQLGSTIIYENPNALPIAMVANKEVKTVDMEIWDSFAQQNAIYQNISGLDVSPMIIAEDVTRERINMYLIVDEVTNPNTYRVHTPGNPVSIRYDIVIEEEKPLYCYFDAPYMQEVNVFVNGEDFGRYFSELRWDAISLGTFPVGETVTVELVPNTMHIVQPYAYFAYEDVDKLAQVCDEIKSRDLELTKHRNSYMTGTVNVEEDSVLMLTIPYDTSWKVCIDGEEAAVECVLGTFLAVDVPAGEHTFSLRYIPKGIYLGGAMSLTAICAACLWFALAKRKEKKEEALQA